MQGKNYTVYWDSDELALLENNKTNAPLEIMRVKYEDNQWQTVEIPQLNQAHEKDFQEMHLAIQRERTQIITPLVTSFLESKYAKNKNLESDSSILRLEGENYILVKNYTLKQIFLLAKDGRGELIQIHADKSATGNLNLKAKDIDNFEQIAQLLSQERDKKERQFH